MHQWNITDGVYYANMTFWWRKCYYTCLTVAYKEHWILIKINVNSDIPLFFKIRNIKVSKFSAFTGCIGYIFSCYILNFAHALCVFSISSTALYGRVSEKKCTMKQFTPMKSWKRHAVLFELLDGTSKTNNSDS